ncbi:MAG: aspartate aminotransferase family protein, partial [Methanoregula sp.]|nr:aspartate aminotransferase family protein [Methanoregula sp.]
MKSAGLFEQAKILIPGGVSSPVRAIKPYPFYTAKGSGSHLTTVDGTDLIDCCMAYGPLLLGHARPEIKKSIDAQLENGWLYGTPIPAEPEFARLITGDHPGMDMARFVS